MSSAVNVLEAMVIAWLAKFYDTIFPCIQVRNIEHWNKLQALLYEMYELWISTKEKQFVFAF